MSQPYLGQIIMFGGNFAPAGWALCNGQSLAISQNDALFALIGTTYGGDGEETFNLPNLQSRVPMHMGQGPGLSQNYQIGEAAGVESVTLTTQQIPAHNHPAQVSSNPATSASPTNTILANEAIGLATANCFSYGAFVSPGVALAQQTIAPAGGSQPHDNMQLYLTLNFVIALNGVFPSQN
jgi:microcystin-dependent protein